MDAGELCIRRTFTADPDETIVAAAQRMAEHGVGDLVVVEPAGDRVRPIGIVTDRDLVTRGLAGGNPLALTVRDVMHADLVTVYEDDPIETVIHRMEQHGVRRMPVIDHAGTLQGIVTLDDIVSWIGEELDDATHLLERQASTT